MSLNILIFQCRYVIKYAHVKGQVNVKMTDDKVVSTRISQYLYIYLVFNLSGRVRDRRIIH